MVSYPGRLKKFVSYYKPYRGLFLADLASAIAAAAVSLVLPLLIRYITADVLSAPQTNISGRIVAPALLMLALILFQTGCALFYDHMGHVMGARIERDMRNELFAHYQTLPFSFFDREKTGAIISRITNDLLSIAELCHHGPEDIIIYFLTFIGALIILLGINVRLALGICLFLPVMFAFSFLYSKTLKKAYVRGKEEIAAVNSRVEDSIAGIRAVKSFGNEDLEIAKFKEANERFYQSRAAIYKHEAWYYTTIGTFFTQLIIAATVVFGGMMLSGASLTVADLISFLLYAGYLTAPIPQLARITAQYQEGLSGFSRFMDILETPGEASGTTPCETARGEKGPLLARAKGEITFDRVSFRYEGGDYILKDLSFTVNAGECIALTGPSGIGKTTLCSLIPRFYEVSAGAILLDGRDIREMDLRALREQIGVVQQEVYVFAGTLRENIAYGKPGASEGEIINAAIKAGAHKFITSLRDGYDTVIGPKGATLSGGQRQRLCIARVFLKDPPILIFDEATSALDYENERVVHESLRNLSGGRTCFVIAHRASIGRALKIT